MAQRESRSLALYAAAGTVAAVALTYVAGPSLFSIREEGSDSRSSGTVGLTNPGNDCFINSVLQAFAGLPELEASLARLVKETASSEANDDSAPSDHGPQSVALEDCAVSVALRDLLKVLNDAPPSRRTTTARPALRTLEYVFRTRISRQQQDAHEFLQILADRLRDEHLASLKHSVSASRHPEPTISRLDADERAAEEDEQIDHGPSEALPRPNDHFPLEGKTESVIQCQVCNYKPKPTASSFVVLTLNVPQKSSATVDECLDGFFKVETIEDFKCQSCCLQHMIKSTEKQLRLCRSTEDKTTKTAEARRLRQVLEEDPEQENVEAPAGQQLPRSQILKHNTIAAYPAVLALHFSRSIFDSIGTSRKNYATLDFPEHLRLGGFEAKQYRLVCLITHKGGHNSGHYVTFRRQQPSLPPPPARASMAQSAEGLKTTDVADQADSDKKMPEARRNTKSKAKWWRISDDHVSECSLKDVLSMQRDAYILFYERSRKP